MVNSLKRLNFIQVISMILLIVSFILVCFGVYNSENLFWVCLSLNMLGYAKFVIKWSREGRTRNRRLDKNYNKNLTRKSSEFIFILLVAYYLLICLCIISDIWIKNFTNEFGTILGLLIISFICNFLSLEIVDRTSKEVNMLLNSKVITK